MALSRTPCTLLLQNIKRYTLKDLIQRYSMFPAYYVKPIFNKSEQESILNSEEGKEIIHTPIRPALTTDSSSSFYDEIIQKFTNYLMRHGDRKKARALIEETMQTIKIMQLEQYNKSSLEEQQNIMLDPKEIFHQAVVNCAPVLQLHRIKKGGIAYQVPVPISEKRSLFTSMNWLIDTARQKDRYDKYPRVLAKEIIDAAHFKGRAIKRKQDLHKQCEANRAYAHFRWQ